MLFKSFKVKPVKKWLSVIVIAPGGGATNPPGAAIADTSSHQYLLLSSVTKSYSKNKTKFTMQSFKLLINRREFIHQLFITRLVMFIWNFDIFYLHSCQFFYHHPPIITPGSTVVACTKLFPAQKVFLHISQYEFFFWLVKGFANLNTCILYIQVGLRQLLG